MLARSCELLAQQPLTSHTFQSFMAVWAAGCAGHIDDDGPDITAYEPAVLVAYGVLLGSGLILKPNI